MFKPYSVVEETHEEVTYEFKTIYLWILYGILIIGGIGLATKEPIIGTVATGCMLIYFFTVSLPYQKLAKIIKRAALTGSVKYSGSKWSFSNPLRMTISKLNAKQESAPNP